MSSVIRRGFICACGDDSPGKVGRCYNSKSETHLNLYYILQMDQAENPMPDQHAQDLWELLSTLYPPDTNHRM